MTLKVGDLVAHLLTMPQDAPVVVADPEEGWQEMSHTDLAWDVRVRKVTVRYGREQRTLTAVAIQA